MLICGLLTLSAALALASRAERTAAGAATALAAPAHAAQAPEDDAALTAEAPPAPAAPIDSAAAEAAPDAMATDAPAPTAVPTATKAAPASGAQTRPPTATSVPPTATPPEPTATPLPPTATPLPPTATPVPPTPTAKPPPPPAGPVNVALTAMEQEMYADHNAERARAGVGGLTLDPVLQQVARARAQDMASKDYFAHTSPTGQTAFTLLSQLGYAYFIAGENIARNNYPNAQAASVAMDGFMNSPGHRENILEPRFNKVGIAEVTAADGMKYFAVVFAGN